MVNTGRPSPACKACRARRLKCDQTKPACIKCIKAKKICPGYREPFEVSFRDQTQSVIRKHGRDGSVGGMDNSPKSNTSSESLSDTSSKITGLVLYEPHGKVPSLSTLRINAPLQDRARGFFMDNFVSPRGHESEGLAFMQPLILNTEEGSPFQATLLATSMAALSCQNRELEARARSLYHKALRKVATMIEDENRSTHDECLGSVVLFILYEAMIFDSNTAKSLHFHINGAQTMVKLRLSQHVGNPIGVAMFEFLRAVMLHQYAHSPLYSLEDIRWWAMEGATGEFGELSVLILDTILVRRTLLQLTTQPESEERRLRAWDLHQKAAKTRGKLEKRLLAQLNVNYEYISSDLVYGPLGQGSGFPVKAYQFSSLVTASSFLNAHIHVLMLIECMFKALMIMNNDKVGNGESVVNDTTTLDSINATTGGTINGFPVADAETVPNLEEDTVTPGDLASLAQEHIQEILSTLPFFKAWPGESGTSLFGAMACSFQTYIAASCEFASGVQRTLLVRQLQCFSERGSRLAEKLYLECKTKAPNIEVQRPLWSCPKFFKTQ